MSVPLTSGSATGLGEFRRTGVPPDEGPFAKKR